jgi:hypothetical protein
MRLKLEVASLQDKYGFDLVSEGLDQVRRDMFDGLEHDVLGCRDCWADPVRESIPIVLSPFTILFILLIVVR